MAPVACTVGEYVSANGTNCLACPAGFACSLNTALPERCSNGTYSLNGWGYCFACPPGYACLHADLLPSQCPQNTYALDGRCLNCTQGTYTPAAGSAYCLPCPEGHSCSADAMDGDPVPCVNGTFSPQGSSDCSACASGTYSGQAAASCTPCPAGYACLDPAGPPAACAFGYFSIGLQQICTACPAGTQSSSSRDRCVGCDYGYECSDPVQPPQECLPGFYTDVHTMGNATILVCAPCPAGHRCIASHAMPITCPLGTFSPPGSSNCTVCPAGAYCPSAALTPQACVLGEYSEEGWDACVDCPAGSACPTTATPPIACETGTYSLGRAQNCSECPPGYLCADQQASPTECDTGGWCVNASRFECQGGFYNPNASSSTILDCSICPAGTYCPVASTLPQVCPSGYYCPVNTEAYTSFPCPAGTYSGAVTGLESVGDCLPCEPGHYCPVASILPTACDPGTWNPFTGGSIITICQDCLAGWACPLPGMYEMRFSCSPGYYCPAGTVGATDSPCPAGTYTDANHTIQEADCLECPQGTHCSAGTGGITGLQPFPCTAGHYCPIGTQFGTQYPCLPGTYGTATNLYHASQCLECPRNYYCAGGLDRYGDALDTVGLCDPGYYCPTNSSNAQQVPCPGKPFATSS